MQLVAYGAQDVYLTGNPQITFFKVVYRRHTNFSCECIDLTFSGSPGFGKSVTSTISRNGDLITKVYLKVVLPKHENGTDKKFALCKNFGFALIDNITCEIGGTQVDKQYGDWMYIWNELAGDRHTQAGLDRMIGNTDAMTKFTDTKERTTLYVPLYFWFCRNNGLALPLIALQYHEVKIKVQFQDRDSVVMTGTKDSGKINNYDFEDASLLVDYIYLDTEERKRFAQASHEYLIEQLQYTGAETIAKGHNKIRLNFNHPCKFLVWGVKTAEGTHGNKVNWDTDPEIFRDQFARTVALLKVAHDNKGSTEDDDSDATGEAKAATNNGDAKFKALADNVDAIVAHVPVSTYLDENNQEVKHSADDNKNKSTIDQVALTSNKLTSEQVSTSLSDLKTWHKDWTGLDEDVHTAQYGHIFDAGVKYRNPLSFSRFADGTGNNTEKCKLQLNGHDRFSERDGNYFNYVQPWQHFSNTPADGINVYSFALNPEEHQPSGTCNMSRIDNACLSIDSEQTGTFSVYAVNYNVLRIMSGMGGLAYSN
jgi:hypothetical protein